MMVVAQISSNATIRAAKEAESVQQTIAKGGIDAKASVRGMQIGMRDIRLAASMDEMRAGSEYLAARQKSVLGFSEEMLRLSQSAENREEFRR